MLCENCKKNNATTYFKQSVNGETKEIFLCSECAKKLGLEQGFGNFGFDLLPKLFTASAPLSEVRCPSCGMPFSEIANTGKVGCEVCYETFSKRLRPVINRIHGAKKHLGKVPASFSGIKKPEEDDLHAQLKKAIEDERFEDAAKIRDQIRDIEKKDGEEE